MTWVSGLKGYPKSLVGAVCVYGKGVKSTVRDAEFVPSGMCNGIRVDLINPYLGLAFQGICRSGVGDLKAFCRRLPKVGPGPSTVAKPRDFPSL